jgi:hypothetical protein
MLWNFDPGDPNANPREPPDPGPFISPTMADLIFSGEGLREIIKKPSLGGR